MINKEDSNIPPIDQTRLVIEIEEKWTHFVLKGPDDEMMMCITLEEIKNFFGFDLKQAMYSYHETLNIPEDEHEEL